MDHTSTTEQKEQELSPQKSHLIFEDAFEDAEEKLKLLLKREAIVEIKQASSQDKQKLVKKWADKLDKSERTIRRWLNQFDKHGSASFAANRRSDLGKLMGSKQWKKNGEEEWENRQKAVDYWEKYINNTYDSYVGASRCVSPHQIYNILKSYAEEELGLKQGEYPSVVFVYKVLKPKIKQNDSEARRPCQGPKIIIKCYNKHSKTEKVLEDILVDRSNLVWQIDHTELNNLLVNSKGERVGSLHITSVVDTYSGCIMGIHLGYNKPGSHETGLALRHAILPKQYGPEYSLERQWEVCGLPEYIVTDNAKEFHSQHFKQILSSFNIKLRYRGYVQQGAAVERPFKTIKTELDALLPGYKGGNIQERPKNAEKWACVMFEEYQKCLIRFITDNLHYRPHPRQEDETRLTLWKKGLKVEPKIPDERTLDIFLLKQTKTRLVQEYGTFNLFDEVYQPGWSKDEKGLAIYNKNLNFLIGCERSKIVLRYNPDNITEVLVYSAEIDGQPAEYLGKARLRDREQDILPLKQLETIKQKVRQKRDNLDMSSVHKERLSLKAFSNHKVSDHRKQAKKGRAKTQEVRQEEQNRITLETPSSNVIPFPSDAKQSTSVENELLLAPKDEVSYEQVEAVPDQEVQVASAWFVIPDWDDFKNSNY